jgi:hypothetical protein
MISFFEINYFRLTFSSFPAGQLAPSFGLGGRLMPSLKPLNESKLMGNKKPGPFERL